MKKISLLFMAVLLLTACKKNVAPTTIESTTSTQSPSGATADMDKIASAMTSGKPVSCSISKKDGTSTMKYFAKGQKIKLTGIATQGSTGTGEVISDGVNFYSWDPATKKGIKMQAPPAGKTTTESGSQGQPFPSIQSGDDVRKYVDDGYTVDCTNVSLSDSDFTPPTDVEFSDLTSSVRKAPATTTNAPQNQAEMEKQAQEMMKQYQK